MAEPGFNCLFFEHLFFVFVEHCLQTKLYVKFLTLVPSLFVTTILSLALLVSASAAFEIAIVALHMLFCSIVRRVSIVFIMLASQHVPNITICCLDLEHLANLRHHNILRYLLLYLHLSESLCYENGQFWNRLIDFFHFKFMKHILEPLPLQI